MNDIYKQLKRPFNEKLISWRVGATTQDKSKGIALAYIDARDVMNRFDEVLGLAWQCKYSHASNKTICDIGIKVGDEWIWRSGGAGDTDVEAEKGAISDALKRAAVLFGVGRYLYELPNEWMPIKQQGKSYVLEKPPQLPEWATPMGYDKGLTPRGNIFGEARTRYLEDIAVEVAKVYARTPQGENDAYQKWESFIPEFKMNEEQMYSWFLLESSIRSAIKRIKSQVNELKKAA